LNGLPQTGILALGTGSHADLELDRVAGVPAADAAARVAALREPRTTISGVNLVIGFRPELWAAVAPDAAPPGVVGFDSPCRALRLRPRSDPARCRDDGSAYEPSSISAVAGMLHTASSIGVEIMAEG